MIFAVLEKKASKSAKIEKKPEPSVSKKPSAKKIKKKESKSVLVTKTT